VSNIGEFLGRTSLEVIIIRCDIFYVNAYYFPWIKDRLAAIPAANNCELVVMLAI
jgi:hypothetical protein